MYEVVQHIKTGAPGGGMRASEWNEIQATLEERLKEIVLSPGLEAAQIHQLLAKIDALLSEVFSYYHRAKTALQFTQARIKAARAAAFLEAKSGQVSPLPGSEEGRNARGVSDEVAKAYAETKVAELGLVTEELEAQRRYFFLEGLIDQLNAKREMLITDAGVLKLEASFLNAH